jgi:hypothetical protein
MGGLASLGNYKVELDAGFFVDEFVLGDSELGGDDTLGGSISFFDITEYVVGVQIKRGRDSQDAQFGAGTCTITIDDLLGEDRFNVANSASPYWNVERGRLGFEPRRRVRISRDGESLFVGIIMAYDTEFSMDDHNIVTVRCADAFVLLTTTVIFPFTPPQETSGQRVDRILGLPEVNYPNDPAPIIQAGVAVLSSVAVESQTPLAYINKIIESAEQGRCFINRSGQLVFEARTPKALNDPSVIEFRDDGTQVPFNKLEVIYE